MQVDISSGYISLAAVGFHIHVFGLPADYCSYNDIAKAVAHAEEHPKDRADSHDKRNGLGRNMELFQKD